MKDFQTFIKHIILYRCRLKKETYHKYFDTARGQEILTQAFTHESMSKTQNYEYFEFLGDALLNTCTAEYLVKNYKNITTPAFLTRIKHTLISNESFKKLAAKYNFFDYCNISNELKNEFASYEIPKEHKEYIKINGDLIESLCGAINFILTENMPTGVGYAAVYNLVSSFLNEIEIPTTYEDVFDASSRLKEKLDTFNAKIRSENENIAYNLFSISKNVQVFIKKEYTVNNKIKNVSDVSNANEVYEKLKRTTRIDNINEIFRNKIENFFKTDEKYLGIALIPKSFTTFDNNIKYGFEIISVDYKSVGKVVDFRHYLSEKVLEKL